MRKTVALFLALILALVVFAGLLAVHAAGGAAMNGMQMVPGAALVVTSAADAPDAAPGDGSCATASGECTLRAALEESNALPGIDLVEVALPLPATVVLSLGELYIADSLQLVGNGVTVDGDGLYRVFHVNGAVTVRFSEMTINNGSATSFGGGILNEGADLELEQVLLEGNGALEGGGLHNLNGTVQVTDSAVTDNGADNGGGIYNHNGTVSVTRTAITSNLANVGAGIYNESGNLTVAGSDFLSNYAFENGGGIFQTGLLGAELWVSGGLFQDNVAQGLSGLVYGNGAAIAVLDGTALVEGIDARHNTGRWGIFGVATSAVVRNATFYSNTLTSTGARAAINSYAGTQHIENVRIMDNAGGGILNGGVMKVVGSLISGNEVLSGGGLASVTQLWVDRTAVVGNRARYGAGIRAVNTGFPSPRITVTNSLISGNVAMEDGGGVSLYQTEAHIANTTIAHNVAMTNHGGIFVGGQLTMVNSTVSANSAGSCGGGVAACAFAADSVANVVQSTVLGNSAPTGANIHNFLLGTFAGTAFSVTNSVVGEPLGGGLDCEGDPLTIPTGVVNLDSDGSCGFSLTGPPGLGPLQDNGGATTPLGVPPTHAVPPTSLAYRTADAGDCVQPPVSALDQRGVVRLDNPSDISCELGAYERVDVVACSVTTPVALPVGTAKISDTLTVGVTEPVVDVDAFVEMSHSYVGDLVMTLTHGLETTLLNRPGVPASEFGCAEDNVRVWLDDSATAAAENLCSPTPPAIGSPPNTSAQPNGALATLRTENTDLNAGGDWTLSVEDGYPSADGGELLTWCAALDLLRCAAPSMAPTATIGVSGGQVELSWTAVPTATVYWIYRAANDFYFTPPSGSPYASTPLTTWLDPGPSVLEDVTNNYAYILEPIIGCGGGPFTQRMGEFTFRIMPGR